jgi:hypothetical protein
LLKYVIGVDTELKLPFDFDFKPSSCNFWKTYSLSVVKYPVGAIVSSFPWITADETQNAPSLKISTVNGSNEAYYTVTVKGNKLYDTSPLEPTFSFKIYLHISPCLRSVLSWGLKPKDIAFRIKEGAVNTPNHFEQVKNTVSDCGPIKYTISSNKPADFSQNLKSSSPTKT